MKDQYGRSRMKTSKIKSKMFIHSHPQPYARFLADDSILVEVDSETVTTKEL